MIEVYSWATPSGHKVHITLEECGLAYRAIPVDIGTGAQFDPAFLRISPNNKIPAIVDPDGPDGEPINDFPHLKGWFDEIGARPAVQRGVAVLADLRKPITGDREQRSAVRQDAIRKALRRPAARLLELATLPVAQLDRAPAF